MNCHDLKGTLSLCGFLFVLGLGLAPGSGSAAEELPGSGRPRIGLVLAGGGAKGGAHVGVLKVLEELRIPIDCVAGTSMGALVGGGYAAGLPPDEIERFMLGIDWQGMVGGVGMRDLEPIEQKRESVVYSNRLQLGIKDGNVQMQAGLVNTNNIENLLRQYVAAVRSQPDFDKLPIPFRAIATNMVDGEMVILEKGDLATALRASMAIPGAFAPVIDGDMILSDGGMVRNIPMDVARDLCAEQLIVVDLVEDQPGPDKLRSATQLISRSTDVMFTVNEKMQLATLRESDVLISVPMGDIGTADFQRIAETLPLGETAARAATERLVPLGLSEADYAAWRREVTLEQDVEVRVAEIVFEGLERVNPNYLRHGATIEVGDVVDTVAIGEEARRMGALSDIESVGYRFEGDPAATRLVWIPVEKSIGPDYLTFDLGFYASVDGDLAYSLFGGHRRTWITENGGEWRNTIQFGRESLLVSSVYLPFDVSQRFFVEPRLFARAADEEFYVDDERIARYRFIDLGGQVDLGTNFSRRMQARLGYLFTRHEAKVDTGSPQFPEIEDNDAGLIASAVYDSRDTRFNPTSGVAVGFEYTASDDALGADRDWETAELGVGVTVPLFGRDVLWVTAAAGSDVGSNLPPDRYFALGGPSSFPGFEFGELRGDSYWTAGTSYLLGFRETTSLRGEGLYTGLRVQAGQVRNRLDGGPDDAIYGASLFLTGRTIVGPLTLGVGTTNEDSWSIWLAVGRPVGHGTILERGIFR